MKPYKENWEHMKKKSMGITLAIIIATSLLAGCGERLEEDREEKVQTSEIETAQEDGLMRSEAEEAEEPALEATVIGAEQEESDFYQEGLRVEPTDEHDRQMLALLDKSCGSKISTYASVDMDQDGENEMLGVAIGAAHDFFIWYCSSDFKDCYIVSDGYFDEESCCIIEQLQFDRETHIVINSYCGFGPAKKHSILALHDGDIEILVDKNDGSVYMNEENDIILDVEYYGSMGHVWRDTYLYYENGKYKEYGAATLSEKDFLKYDNARELMEKIEKENGDEDVLEVHYSYYIRENGIVHIECELVKEELDEYYDYTVRENGNHLDGELFRNPGGILPHLSQLDEVTYP